MYIKFRPNYTLYRGRVSLNIINGSLLETAILKQVCVHEQGRQINNLMFISTVLI